MGRRAREAPLFIGTYTFLIVASVLLVMLFPNNLAALIILPNIVGAVLLPIILILMLRLVNTKRLMGELHQQPHLYNAIAGTTTVVLIILSMALLYTILAPMLSHNK